MLGNNAASGAIGGSRGAVANSTLANQQGLSAGQTMAGLYNNALGAAQTTAGQEQGTAYTLGNLGQQSLNTDITSLMAGLQGGNQLQQQQQNTYNTATQNAIQQNQYQTMMAKNAAGIAGIGGLLGGSSYGSSTTTMPVNYLGMILGGLSAGAGLMGGSDRRIKENIKVIGKTKDGQNIYKYNFKGSPKTEIGLMAQDVEKKHPEAVGTFPGTDIKGVNYDLATKDAEPKHRALGGGLLNGTGVSQGMAGLQNGSGLTGGISGGLDISQGLMPFLQGGGQQQPQAPQANLPQSNAQQQGQQATQQMQQQQQQQMQQMQQLAKLGQGSNAGAGSSGLSSLNNWLGNQAYGSTPGGFLGGLGSSLGFAQGGAIHRDDGGGVANSWAPTVESLDAAYNIPNKVANYALDQSGFGRPISEVHPFEALSRYGTRSMEDLGRGAATISKPFYDAAPKGIDALDSVYNYPADATKYIASKLGYGNLPINDVHPFASLTRPSDSALQAQREAPNWRATLDAQHPEQASPSSPVTPNSPPPTVSQYPLRHQRELAEAQAAIDQSAAEYRRTGFGAIRPGIAAVPTGVTPGALSQAHDFAALGQDDAERRAREAGWQTRSENAGQAGLGWGATLFPPPDPNQERKDAQNAWMHNANKLNAMRDQEYADLHGNEAAQREHLDTGPVTPPPLSTWNAIQNHGNRAIAGVTHNPEGVAPSQQEVAANSGFVPFVPRDPSLVPFQGPKYPPDRPAGVGGISRAPGTQPPTLADLHQSYPGAVSGEVKPDGSHSVKMADGTKITVPAPKQEGAQAQPAQATDQSSPGLATNTRTMLDQLGMAQPKPPQLDANAQPQPQVPPFQTAVQQPPTLEQRIQAQLANGAQPTANQAAQTQQPPSLNASDQSNPTLHAFMNQRLFNAYQQAHFPQKPIQDRLQPDETGLAGAQTMPGSNQAIYAAPPAIPKSPQLEQYLASRREGLPLARDESGKLYVPHIPQAAPPMAGQTPTSPATPAAVTPAQTPPPLNYDQGNQKLSKPAAVSPQPGYEKRVQEAIQGPVPQGVDPEQWKKVPHTPQLADNRTKPRTDKDGNPLPSFAEELRNPALREKALAIALNEQGDPTGNLGVLETAMNRAAVNKTTLAQELRWTSEGGYYDDKSDGHARALAALQNPNTRAMAERNLQMALGGSNVAKYMTDNNSGAWGAHRNASGMYTAGAQYNGENLVYPSRPDARGYAGFPQWLQSVGGTIEGGLHDFAGTVGGIGHGIQQGAQQLGQHVAALPGQIQSGISSAYEHAKTAPSAMGDMFSKLGFATPSSLQEQQGLGGTLGRMLGFGLPISQDASNRLVDIGAGMMAAGPSAGKSPLGGLANVGKGLQYGNTEDQARRAQALNMYQMAMKAQLQPLEMQKLQRELQTPVEVENIFDPNTFTWVKKFGIPDKNAPNGHYWPVGDSGAVGTPDPIDAIPPELEGKAFVDAAKKAGISSQHLDIAQHAANYDDDPNKLYPLQHNERALVDRLAHHINHNYNMYNYPAVAAAEKKLANGDTINSLSRIGRLFDEIVQTNQLADRMTTLGAGDYENMNALKYKTSPSGSEYGKTRDSLGYLLDGLSQSAAAVAKGNNTQAESDAARRFKLLNPDKAPSNLKNTLKEEAALSLTNAQTNLTGVNKAHGYTVTDPRYKTALDYMNPNQRKKVLDILGPDTVESIIGKPIDSTFLSKPAIAPIGADGKTIALTPEIPAEATKLLREKPDTREQFDKKYGTTDNPHPSQSIIGK